jgi:hypothetical protein
MASHEFQASHTKSKHLVSFLNGRAFPHEPVPNLFHLSRTNKAILTLQYLLICRYSSFDENVVQQLPFPLAIAYALALDIPMAVSFAEEKD